MRWALYRVWASLGAQLVRNLPAVQETRVRALDWEDPLEKEMATHSSLLAWKISCTEQPGGLQSMGLQRVGHDWATNTYLLMLKDRVEIDIIISSYTYFWVLNDQKSWIIWIRILTWCKEHHILFTASFCSFPLLLPFIFPPFSLSSL